MSTEVIGSNFPTEASDQLMPVEGRKIDASHIGTYGQNQFGGASSDTPGNRTASGFLPDPGKPINNQLRPVKADPLPTAFGMKNPNKRG